METITSIKPVLAVSVSLVITVFIIASGKRPNLRESWTFVAGIIKFCIVASMVPVVLGGKEIVCNLVEIVPGVGTVSGCSLRLYLLLSGSLHLHIPSATCGG